MWEFNKIGFLSVDRSASQLERECGFVGAATCDGVQHTSELKVMKFDEAMATKDKPEWEVLVGKEHDKFQKYMVWEPVDKSEVPADAKVLTSTCTLKPKANRVKRARLNARGFEKVDGLHYDSKDLLAPVVSNMTVRMVTILIIMAAWAGQLMD
eukprot:11154868-Ditylum_brightwellii.AAC.1